MERWILGMENGYERVVLMGIRYLLSVIRAYNTTGCFSHKAEISFLLGESRLKNDDERITMAQYTEDDVRNVLKEVIFPFLNMDVISSGLVRDIAVQDHRLTFSVDIPVPPKPVLDDFIMELKTRVQRSLPHFSEIQIESHVRIAGQAVSSVLPAVKNTVAVSSGKGGVGKSTVAVNLAVALAQAGAKVGLIDADIYGPSIPLMMGIHTQPRAYQEGGKTRLLPCENYGVKVMSIGFLIDPDQAIVWRGPMASGALKQFLTDVDWGELDYLLFDMPPGTGDIQLTLSQSLPLTGAVIITTPQDISLADARKGVRMFEKVNVPILGIIENMSYFICSHCGQRDEIFDYGGGRAAAEELNVRFLGELPIVTKVRVAGDKGVPIVELQPEMEIAGQFREVAMTLTGVIAQNHLTSAPAPKIAISL